MQILKKWWFWLLVFGFFTAAYILFKMIPPPVQMN
jgi:hypothetical protein